MKQHPVFKLMKRISLDPLSVTGDDIMEVVEGVPKEVQRKVLMGMFYLKRRSEQRLKMKLIKGGRPPNERSKIV